MPHPLRSLATHAAGTARGAWPQRWTDPVPSTARWDVATARAWRERVGWLVGCNFTPSTAGNQLEMFQEATYDPERIDLELGWAADLGLNSIRVFLHHLLHAEDAAGFADRVDDMLSIAARHEISVMLVPFDGVWHPDPRLDRPMEPRPRLHNSIWLQSPGAPILGSPDRWVEMKPYVDALLDRFGDDDRVLAWDLFNEPDQTNAISYASKEISRKTEHADGFLNLVFDWATARDPSQPLTAGIFTGVSGAPEKVSGLNRTMLARSDVISFHCYLPERRFRSAIAHLERYERPLLCTEWMARTLRSPAVLLDVLAEHGVGAYHWGLVDGRTQTRFPWTSWVRPRPDDGDVWFHDMLHPDGHPYDEAEAALFRRLSPRS